ncbi:MAG: hypothetical protein OJF59_002003 [Cytophagales bacterium]|jgi:hypothetical protein|nr:hypothetical protein [Bacteroidota bacterium]MBS1980899.1 hypothetical protein [Bacteroidota bacterium]WHZ08250.1 MAG: hypothetical protein OJF59_002003 [Cytophagales bacterium]
MKTLLALFVLVPMAVSATIRTVSNDINKPAQYPDIPPAVAAANSGDTIYVNGTQYTYSDFTVTKKLVIIGAGYNVANQFNLISMVNNISFFKDAGVNDGSGTVITGFKIYAIGVSGSSLGITNIKIFRNQISGISANTGTSNWTVYNNLITGYLNGANASSNFIIQNNIFFSGGNVVNFNQPSVVIDHNLFINDSGALSALQFAIVTNNIFTSSSNTLVMSNINQCTFNSNMSISTNISSYTPSNSFLANGNTGGANQSGSATPTFIGVNPQFVADGDFNTYNNTFNYRLSSGSPGHNAASDGTDIGIYGGTYPFPSGGAPGSGYDTSPLPPIPQINSVNIQNASVLPGQQLQVNVTATVNN